MGHYCRICGLIRANEKFSGRGHRAHICKDCQRQPLEERDRITCRDVLYGFVNQSHISAWGQPLTYDFSGVPPPWRAEIDRRDFPA